MGRLSRLSTLVASWILYWLLLVGVKLGPAIAAIMRATGGPSDGKSSVNVSYGDSGFVLDVAQQGQTVYHASASAMSLVLWIGIPPLVLWVLWAALRRRQVSPRNEPVT